MKGHIEDIRITCNPTRHRPMDFPDWFLNIIDALKFAAAVTLAAAYLISVILGAAALTATYPHLWFLFLGGGIFLLAFGAYVANQ